MIIFDKKSHESPESIQKLFWSIQAIHDLTFNL